MKHAVLLLALGACAHNVAQDKATTEDGKVAGAEAVPLVNNRAIATGIVTYPGGDRIDWKSVELPAKLEGSLDVKLTWSTPRPGLQLAFDVFDATNNKQVATSGRNRRRGPRVATVARAKGKYLIRVYAVGRGDAGRYKLDLAFIEDKHKEPDWTKVKIPDPPRLAELPTAPIVWPRCDVLKPDFANPNCEKECPTGAPASWPGCKGQCRNPGDLNDPACRKLAICPNPNTPDRTIPDCLKYFKKCPDPRDPDPANPNCDDVEIPPVRLRVTLSQIVDTDELMMRTSAVPGISMEWTAEVLVGGTAAAAPANDNVLAKVKIHRVDPTYIELRTSVRNLTKQQSDANKWVRFRAPAKPKKKP